MSEVEVDRLRWLIDGGPVAPKPIPAKVYDQLKKLGWDTRPYTRKPEPTTAEES